MAMTEDLTAFLSTSEFAVDVVIGATTYQGILDKDFIAVTAGEASVESVGPAVHMRDVDVSGVAHGTSITVGGTAYTVRGIEPDGTGMTTLILEAA